MALEATVRGAQITQTRASDLQAKSVGSSGVSYNVYIFNIQAGVKINYSTGTSQYGNPAAAF